MKQNMSYLDETTIDISIEDFDALDEKHIFSDEYKKNKKKMLKEYRQSILTTAPKNHARAVAALLLFIISLPIIANAATNGDFFNRIWGSLGRKNVASHEEVLYDEQNFPYIYTFPEREYVDIDPKRAKELIGDSLSYESIVKKLGDTTLTILSSVYDGNAVIIEFTLEREGGVNAFNYSQLDNELRGATFSYDATFWFEFIGCNEKRFVDLSQSTENVLHCYNYIMLQEDAYNPETKGITLEVSEYPCTRGDLFTADEETFDQYISETQIEDILIPLGAEIKKKEYVNASGGIIQVSPMSMKIDMDTGLGLSEEEAYNLENVYYAAVTYKDKTNYIVCEHELSGIHSCDVKIDNSSYMDVDVQRNLVIIFNRLVDTDKIESITINETIYTAD